MALPSSSRATAHGLCAAVVLSVSLGACKRAAGDPPDAGAAPARLAAAQGEGQAVLAKLKGLALPDRPSFEVVQETPFLALRARATGSRQAFELWSALRAARARHGLLPVVVLDDAAQRLTSQQRPPTTDEPAPAASLADFLAGREVAELANWTEILRDELELPTTLKPRTTYAELQQLCVSRKRDFCPAPGHPWSEERKALAAAHVSPAPPAEELDFYFAGLDAFHTELATQFGGTPKLEAMSVWLFALPSHRVPVELGFGGFNACPSAAEHAVVLAEWGQRYGAEVAYVGGDILELAVDRPPRTEAALKEVAWQQYVYCEDIVSQGTGTIGHLAEELAGKRTWYFWWD